MTTEVPTNEAARLTALEGELRAERRRVAQREQMIATLNRRLVVLEQTASSVNPATGMPTEPEALRERVRELEAQLDEVTQELERMRHTKLFTWSAPLRQLYALLRR